MLTWNVEGHFSVEEVGDELLGLFHHVTCEALEFVEDLVDAQTDVHSADSPGVKIRLWGSTNQAMWKFFLYVFAFLR